MDIRMSRRSMLRSSLLLAAGSALGAGCTPRAAGWPPASGGVSRRLAPVRVSPDRVIRTLAGLRPYRSSGFVVRSEPFGERTLVHNYGHGGGGVTLSWGSAELAAELAARTGRTRFAVLGSGVIGLTTARRLQDRGFAVTIYTRDLPPNTTSNIAGGHWAPTSVADFDQTTPGFRAQFERAARFANRYFQNLVGDHYGVRWIENYALTDEPGSPWGANSPIGDLYPESVVLGPGAHPFGSPYVRRYSTMLVEPATFLDAVTRDFLLRGGRIVIRDFQGLHEVAALEEPVIVNCTGLGSGALFNDPELVPVKGQLAVLLPQPEVDYIAMRSGHYMFPRSDGIILGGTFERGVWSLENDPAALDEIIAGHQAIFETMNG